MVEASSVLSSVASGLSSWFNSTSSAAAAAGGAVKAAQPAEARGLLSSATSPAVAARKAALLGKTALNGGRAVDYQLQETLASSVSLGGSYVGALSAHTSYWTLPDFACFVISRLE